MKRACEGQCSCGGTCHHHGDDNKVWQDPTDYSAVQDGPPYLKLSSVQRKEIEPLLKKAAYYDTQSLGRALEGRGRSPLTILLGLLQALSHLHQIHHWNTMGDYGDHLLFQRLYEQSQDFIDQVAERAVGSKSVAAIEPAVQGQIIHSILLGLSKNDEEGTTLNYVETSLQGELNCLRLIKSVIQVMESDSTLSPGISNLLEGLADLHETFVYLLQQRTRVDAYNYMS
jgi:DNA-binding ferritin-like protein